MRISGSAACVEWLVRHYVYFYFMCFIYKDRIRVTLGVGQKGNMASQPPASPVHLSSAVRCSVSDFTCHLNTECGGAYTP